MLPLEMEWSPYIIKLECFLFFWYCMFRVCFKSGCEMLRSVPWSQRFFLIFLRERDQEQTAKRRQRVAKATRRERKTSGYLGLESHFHVDDSCQTCQIANKKSDQWQLSKHLSLIHIWRCRRIERCRSRWSPYH